MEDDPQLGFQTLPLDEDDIEAMVLLEGDRITLPPPPSIDDDEESEIFSPLDV